MLLDGDVRTEAEGGQVGHLAEAVEIAGTPSWQEAHRQLQRIARRRGALDAAEAHWLVVARDTGVHVELGYGSLGEYLQRVLGYAPRTARERVRVAEALARLPAIRDALARGAVPFSVVRELTREFIRPETEQAWLAAVEGKTVREVEELVVGRECGDLPSDPRTMAAVPRRLRLELTAETYAAWVEARRALEDEVGGPLNDDTMVATLIRRAFDAASARASTTRPRHQIAMTVCEACERATVDAGGQVIDVEPAALAHARCDAAHVGRLDDPHASYNREIPDKIRRFVERRDHHRCTVPGCRSTRDLEIHHIVWRSRGGVNDPSNLTLTCLHHHLACHAGRLYITGTAPGGLHFTHADGRPYGTDPVGGDVFDDARRALRGLGYSASEAAAAVERARATVDPAGGLEAVIRASLRACRPSTR